MLSLQIYGYEGLYTAIQQHQSKGLTEVLTKKINPAQAMFRLSSTLPKDLYHALKVSLVIVSALIVLISCTVQTTQSFDPQHCMETVPKNVRGLKILAGSRSEKNIITDMVPIYCNSQVLYFHMRKSDPTLQVGEIFFQISVEYTGEVIEVRLLEADAYSKKFVRKISDMIMDSDFTSWTRDETDTVFIYPFRFNN